MKTVKVVRNRYGALNGYIGNEWAESFGEERAIDWLAEQIEAGNKLSDKSVITASDIESQQRNRASFVADHAA